MSDDEVARFRAEIGEVDRELLDAVNRRLELVRALKRYKEEHGIAFVDAAREAELLDERVRQNHGPLSEAGVRAFFEELLALIKRELG
jgi:chorismate mutase / prephenate dehydratase